MEGATAALTSNSLVKGSRRSVRPDAVTRNRYAALWHRDRRSEPPMLSVWQ